MEIFYLDIRDIKTEEERIKILESFDLGGWTCWAVKYNVERTLSSQKRTSAYARVSWDFSGEPVLPKTFTPECKLLTYEPTI